MKQIIILFSILLLSFSCCFASDENMEKMGAANDFYQKGKYEEALKIYKLLFDKGLESPDLYYNLGNTYFKTKDIPSAILFYEKAKKLDPSDEEIDFNLKVANQRIIDKTEAIPELFYQRWYSKLLRLFSVNGWAIELILVLILSLISFAIYFASRSPITKRIGFYFGVVLFALVIISFVFAKRQYTKATAHNEAIVFSPTVTVKSSPDEKGQDLFVIHEGSKVYVLDNIGEWSEIRLLNGSVGWMKSTMLEII